MREATLIRAQSNLSYRAQPYRESPTQLLPVTLEKRPKELPLSVCLLNRGGNPIFTAPVHTAPLVSA